MLGTEQRTVKVDRAVAFIRQNGAARTNKLAALLDLEPRQVDALLAEPAATGVLITCDVQLGDGSRTKEYRCSAAGAVKNPYRVGYPKPAAERAPDRAPTPATTPSPSRPVATEEKSMADKKPLAERIVEALRAHGNLTLTQLAKHAGTTVSTLYTMMGSLKKKHGVQRISISREGAVYGLGEPEPKAPQATKPPKAKAPKAADPYAPAMEGLRARRAELVAEIAKIDRAIEAIGAIAA